MITPRKGLVALTLVLLLCGLLNPRWTGWLTRPVNAIVDTTQYPAGWLASQLKAEQQSETSNVSTDPISVQLEMAEVWNQQLWQENQRLREQIEAFKAIAEIQPIDAIRLVESRVSRFNKDRLNPSMKLLRGSLHGVQRDNPVVYKANLLGFVTDPIGPATSNVSLITRPGFGIQVNIMPPPGVDVGPGWPVVDRVRSDGEGGFTCDLRIKIAEALEPGDVVRVNDELRASANGFVLGVIDRVEKHPSQPELLRRVYIKPRTPIGPQGMVTVLTQRTD